MPRLSARVAETDRRIRERKRRIALYRNRIDRRKHNPALAEQAERLLPLMIRHLTELVRFRRHLARALEIEAALSDPTANAQRKLPRRVR